MINYLILVTCWIFITSRLVSAQGDVQSFGRCVSPTQERSLCIHLEECQYLYNLLQSPNLQNEDKKFLSKSQCGYQNGKVLICCPDRYRQATPLETTSSKVNVGTRGNGLLPQPGTCGNVLSNRIYGGNITKIDEFPWMALIEYTKGRGNTGHHCGGSLINNRYVITASHCVNGASLPTDWKLTGVRLGEWDTTTNPDCEVDVRGKQDCAPPYIDIPVEQVIPHPDYSPNSRNQINDIALLRLARNVEYTDFIRPICLPVDQNLRRSNLDGTAMDVVGWGKTEHTSSSSLKLKALVEGTNFENCRKIYGSENIKLEANQMCAGGQEGIDSCRGDSGGPLIALETTSRVRVYYYLAGIVSFGPTPCGLQGWPGVYTKVGPYVNWIEQTIAA